MTREELYNYIAEPKLLSQTSLPDLRQLAETYPYCASIVCLYLYNLAKSGDLQYASELEKYSLYLHDRRFLCQLLEGAVVLSDYKTDPIKSDDSFSLIDQFLKNKADTQQSLPSDLDLKESSVKDDYFASCGLSFEEPPLKDEKENESLLTPSQDQAVALKEPSDLEEENEELFTETLAKIYIKQGKYEKALRIIRSISLNYPKKNRYFAVQIRFLERLVENNKENN